MGYGHLSRQQRDGVELIFFLILAAICIVAAIYVMGAIFAAPGYVILLILDEATSFWKSAAVGFGSLILIVGSGGALSSIIRAIKS